MMYVCLVKYKIDYMQLAMAYLKMEPPKHTIYQRASAEYKVFCGGDINLLK